ncbi:MAG: TfoX/Sxy family protein [Ignavibacteriae bacterium]|nr:TfoX/Sxy family protein [Ignavibacteriota bacterium]
MKNLGPVSLGWLREIGVVEIEALRRIGAVPVFLEVKKRHPKASLNLLWALEGAVQDIHWMEVTSERKQELKELL